MTEKWFNLCMPNYFLSTEFYYAMRVLEIAFCILCMPSTAKTAASTVATSGSEASLYRFIKIDVLIEGSILIV